MNNKRTLVPYSCKTTLVDVLIILLVGFLSITWFRGSFIIKAGDSFVSLFPLQDLVRSSYVWDSIFSTGIPNPRSPAMLPFELLMVILNAIFSLVASEKILVYSVFTLSGLSMYYLSRVIVNKEHRRITGLFSAFFYMMNPFSLTNVWGTGLITIIFAYPLLPLVLGLLIKGLYTRNFCYFFLMSFLWVIFSISLSNTAYAATILLVLFLYVGFYMLKERKSKINILYALKRSSFLIMSVIVTNFWWILPSMFFIGQQLEAAKVSGDPLAVFIGTSKYTSILNSFRLLGAWTLYSKHFDPYFPWSSTYSTPIFILTSLLIPVLVFIPLLFMDKIPRRKDVMFFVILTLGSLFIIKGAHSPLGTFNIWLFRNIPLSAMFRNSYEKLGMAVVVPYAFLIGISISHFYYYLKKVNRNIHYPFLIVFFLVVNVAYMFPFWTGDVIHPGGEIMPSYRIQVPQYYREAGKWINRREENFKILTIPAPSIARTSAYNWEHGYVGSDPLVQYFFHNIPFVTMGLTGNLAVDNLQRQIVAPFYDDNTAVLTGRLLGLVNIRYVLFHRDFNTKYSHSPPLPQFENFLNGQKEINLEKSFGKLDLYKISNEHFLPHIYPTITPTLVAGNIEALVPMSYTKYLDGKPVLLFTEQMEEGTNHQLLSDSWKINNIVFYNSNWGDLAAEVSPKLALGEQELEIGVKKEKREKAQKEIQRIIDMPGVNVGYLFSGEGGDLVNRCFDIPDDSEYIIKAKLSPNFVRAKISISGGLSLDFGLQEEFKKWSFKPSNVTYSYSVEPGILILSAYFDGDSEEDEYVQMRREGLKIDLEEYSWFDLTCKVEDPKVQTIEVVLGVDFDGDGDVDEYIKGIYPRAAATEFDKFSYNALGKVKRCFPDKEHYDLLELELYPHKLWRVDCKSFKRRGKYKFCIKNLEFCNYSPKDFFKISDYSVNSNLGEEWEFGKWRDTSNLKSYSCNIQDGNLVVTARFGEKIDENVTLSRSFENLNLEKFPFIEFEYKVDDPLFQNLEIILSLDFDKDGIADKDIFSSVSLDRTFKKFKFNAFGMVRETYPDMEGYYLLQVRLRLREGRKNFIGFARKGEYSWYFRNIKIYSTSFASPNDFTFDEPVFEIDGEKYWFRKEFKDKKDTKDVLFNKKASLKKGEHSISSLLGEEDNFEIDWIIIEPMSVDLPAENEPKIVFGKVNPTKYEVKVEGAKEPFWLVFSESFHKDWRLYCSPSLDLESFREIVADYPELGVSEGKHGMRFTPKDIGYLFRGTDVREHYLVNGYANGWYVEPDKLGLGGDFKLTLYFWPQSLFYLGLGISALTLTGSLVYLVRRRRRKN